MDLVIEPATEGKGRSFKATLLSYVTSNRLVPAGNSIRPAWMMLAASENELRPFLANLRTGRKAKVATNYGRGGDSFEVLKSSGYQSFVQKTEAGAVATLYLPDLFRADPGMVDPEQIAFCVLPSSKFLVPNPEGEAHILRYLEAVGLNLDSLNQYSELLNPTYLATLATAVAAFLDRRTRCPLIPDKRFFAQILVAALHERHASLSMRSDYAYDRDWGRGGGHYREVDTDTVGLSPGVMFHSGHETFEEFLAEQVKLFLEITNG